MHHCQLAFSEQAGRPVPQENLLFVEQAGSLREREWWKISDRSDFPPQILQIEGSLTLGVNLSEPKI